MRSKVTMKKKIMLLLSTSLLFSSYAITAFAKEATDSGNSGFSYILSSLAASPAAIIGLLSVIFCIAIFVIFRKKLTNRLDGSSASLMTNIFILFFAINGIACLFMAFATEGATWSNLMHVNPASTRKFTQFEDYILNLQYAGTQNFAKSAKTNSPFSHLIYFILAQFLPNNFIFATKASAYTQILKNQTFMYMYLILTMFAFVLLYKMNRSVLRNNRLNIRDEIIAFMLVVSYPAIYCIEKGNITILSLVLTMAFVIFHNDKNIRIREAAYIALAASAAITPYTIVFALILVNKKVKVSVMNVIRIMIYFLILFVTPVTLTGTKSMVTYLKALTEVSTDFVAGNMSISNILCLFGNTNSVVAYIFVILTQLIAILAIILLPATWQKASAAVYFILNIFAVSDAVALLFVFIPLILLLGEKKHNASDWLYLLAFALLITPLPEWYSFDSTKFFFFIESIGIYGIRNANHLIDFAVSQFILILIAVQSIGILKNKRKLSAPAPEAIQA